MAEPTITPQIKSRVITHDVMTGAAVRLVRDGTVVDGVTVSATSYSTIPCAGMTPPPYGARSPLSRHQPEAARSL